MKTLTLTLLITLTFVLTARANKLNQWYKLLPKNTLGVISIKDTPELLADWEKSSFTKMRADPEFKKWVAPGITDGEFFLEKSFKEAVGETVGDFFKHLQGSIMIAIAADTPEDFKGTGGPAIALIEVGAHEARMEELWQRHFDIEIQKGSPSKKITREIAGVKVQILVESDAPEAAWRSAYAFVDGTMIMGVRESLFKFFIPALKTGTADSAEIVTDHLTRLAHQSESDADISLYINGETIMKWMEEGMAKGSQIGPKSAMPFDPSMIMDALGAHELQSIGLMMDLSETQSRVDMILLHPEKMEGVLTFLQGSSIDLTLPSFIPRDALSGQVSRQSLSSLYDHLLAMIAKLGPMAMMATMQISQLEQQMGFKIKEDLFASLADEIVQITDGTAEAQSQVIGFKVKHRSRLHGALDALKRFLGQGFGDFETSDFMGTNIRLFRANAALAAPGAKSTEIAYCLTDDYLFLSIGKQDLLKQVLTRINDVAEPSLWETPRTQELIAMLPKGYSGLGVSNVGPQINLMIEAMTAVHKQNHGTKKKPETNKDQGPVKGPKVENTPTALTAPDRFFDPKAQPSDAMFKKYFGSVVIGTYSKPGTLLFRMLSKPVETAQ